MTIESDGNLPVHLAKRPTGSDSSFHTHDRIQLSGVEGPIDSGRFGELNGRD